MIATTRSTGDRVPAPVVHVYRPAHWPATYDPIVTVMHTVDDIRRANAAAGFHFFDRDTLRAFGSRILSTCRAGYFVTSEGPPFLNPEWGARAYTVRRVRTDGSIDTVGGSDGFRAWPTRRAALAELDRLAELEPFTLHDPARGYCVARWADDAATRPASNGEPLARLAGGLLVNAAAVDVLTDYYPTRSEAATAYALEAIAAT